MNVARVALIVVAMIGMSICGTGVGKVAARNAWLHPLALVSMALGALAMSIVAGALLNLELPAINGDMAAIAAVVAIIVVKATLTQIHALA